MTFILVQSYIFLLKKLARFVKNVYLCTAFRKKSHTTALKTDQNAADGHRSVSFDKMDWKFG